MIILNGLPYLPHKKINIWVNEMEKMSLISATLHPPFYPYSHPHLHPHLLNLHIRNIFLNYV